MNPFAYLLALFTLPFLRGQQRLALADRMKATRARWARRRAEQKMNRDLAKEARLYADLIQSSYATLGEMYTARYTQGIGMHVGYGRKGRPRTHYVRFERILATPEIIYYKILIRKRNWLGLVRNALPHLVRVRDLISPETVEELSAACERKVEAAYDNPRNGVWLKLYRTIGLDGLPTIVRFRPTLEHYPQDMSTGPILLGIGAHRQPHILTLESSPQWIIAGSTGTGKSVCVNGILLGQIFFQRPEDTRVILIDLKGGVEFDMFKDIPHLYCPPFDGTPQPPHIIVDVEEAVKVLEAIKADIDVRYRRLAGKSRKFSDWNRAYPNEKMPRVLVVIDEYAQLVLGRGRKFKEQATELVESITSIARAAGYHMLVATQYPVKEVVSSLVKVNASVRIAFRVQTPVQSQVIINTGEAASLPDVKGRAVYGVGADTFHIQAPFVSQEDIDFVLQVARGRAAGVVDIEGIEPHIITDGLLFYILRELGGSLNYTEIFPRLRQLAISKPMLTAWLEDARKLSGEITIGSTRAKVWKERNGVWLRPLASEPPAPAAEPVAPAVETIDPTIEPPTVETIESDTDLGERVWEILKPPPWKKPESPAPEPVKMIEFAPPKYADPLGAFIEQMCITAEDVETPLKKIFPVYVAWCAEQGVKAMNNPQLSKALIKRGCKRRRLDSHTIIIGIALRSSQVENAAAD